MLVALRPPRRDDGRAAFAHASAAAVRRTAPVPADDDTKVGGSCWLQCHVENTQCL
jgi:hypothetical protein